MAFQNKNNQKWNSCPNHSDHYEHDHMANCCGNSRSGCGNSRSGCSDSHSGCGGSSYGDSRSGCGGSGYGNSRDSSCDRADNRGNYNCKYGQYCSDESCSGGRRDRSISRSGQQHEHGHKHYLNQGYQHTCCDKAIPQHGNRDSSQTRQQDRGDNQISHARGHNELEDARYGRYDNKNYYNQGRGHGDLEDDRNGSYNNNYKNQGRSNNNNNNNRADDQISYGQQHGEEKDARYGRSDMKNNNNNNNLEDARTGSYNKNYNKNNNNQGRGNSSWNKNYKNNRFWQNRNFKYNENAKYDDTRSVRGDYRTGGHFEDTRSGHGASELMQSNERDDKLGTGHNQHERDEGQVDNNSGPPDLGNNRTVTLVATNSRVAPQPSATVPAEPEGSTEQTKTDSERSNTAAKSDSPKNVRDEEGDGHGAKKKHCQTCTCVPFTTVLKSNPNPFALLKSVTDLSDIEPSTSFTLVTSKRSQQKPKA